VRGYLRRPEPACPRIGNLDRVRGRGRSASEESGLARLIETQTSAGRSYQASPASIPDPFARFSPHHAGLFSCQDWRVSIKLLGEPSFPGRAQSEQGRFRTAAPGWGLLRTSGPGPASEARGTGRRLLGALGVEPLKAGPPPRDAGDYGSTSRTDLGTGLVSGELEGRPTAPSAQGPGRAPNQPFASTGHPLSPCLRPTGKVCGVALSRRGMSGAAPRIWATPRRFTGVRESGAAHQNVGRGGCKLEVFCIGDLFRNGYKRIGDE
jgi:hypothetical protein